MAASAPGSWPDALPHIEKPDPLESIQLSSKAGDHISGYDHGHDDEINEVLPNGKGTAKRMAKLPPKILEQ